MGCGDVSMCAGGCAETCMRAPVEGVPNRPALGWTRHLRDNPRVRTGRNAAAWRGSESLHDAERIRAGAQVTVDAGR